MYSSRCNLVYNHLPQIYKEEKDIILEITTFKGLLDRYKFAFFGDGSQGKIEN